MKRRKWDPKTKAMIVLQGLKGKSIVDLCNEHQISQTQYYLWREQFLANMQKAFINDEHGEKILLKENDRLKQAVGELHLKLEKTKLVVEMKRKESELIAERNSTLV